MDYLLNDNEYIDVSILDSVLNLIINGLPSKRKLDSRYERLLCVLNLIINGLPSKQRKINKQRN